MAWPRAIDISTTVRTLAEMGVRVYCRRLGDGPHPSPFKRTKSEGRTSAYLSAQRDQATLAGASIGC